MDMDQGRKPTKYYIDFENVHGAGLKGVEDLNPEDEVLIFYSQAAETFHIEHAINILNSRARIRFVEIDGGTRNSLDFQLVAALFGTMDDEHEYAIVSGDGGFDAAIKMGQRLELSPVRRITDLTGSTEAPPSKSRQQRQARQAKKQKEKEQEAQKEAQKDAQGKKVQQDQNGQSGQNSQNGQKAQGAQKEQPQNGQQVQNGQKAQQPRKDQADQQGAKTPKKLPVSRRRHQLPAPAPASEPMPASAPATASAPDSAPEAKPDGSAPGSSADQTRSIANGAGDKPEADIRPEGERPDAPALPEGERFDAPATPEDDQNGASAPAKSGRYSKRKEVKALLASNGVNLNQQELSQVMKALNGVKNKQGFYRGILHGERQDKALALYRQVRDYYEAMVEILRA